MPKHNPTYTPQFDKVLIELVERVGEAKWAEITRQMKQIYGLKVPQKPMVQARWRAIDPKINRDPFTAEEFVTHWHICLAHKCHWDAVKAEYEEMGQKRDKCYLSQKFYSLFQFKLTDLNRIMQRSYNQNQLRIEEMRDTTKKRILEIHTRDTKTIFDKASVEVILSTQILLKLLTYLVENHKEDIKTLGAEIRQYITAEKFQRVLQNIFLIDTIVLIACNELKPTDKDRRIIKFSEQGNFNYRKPTQIKSWEQALVQVSSPDVTEDETIIKTSVKIRKYAFIGSFTKSDIDEIKSSQVYQVCNTDQNQTFYDWYNEAKIQKATVRTECLVDIVDIMNEEEKEKNSKPKQPTKKTESLAKKQMKLIEKKKEILMKQTNDEKIKTVRGKIKMDKEVFPGCYTKFFNREDSDQSELSICDPEQIYHLAMQNQQFADEQI